MSNRNAILYPKDAYVEDTRTKSNDERNVKVQRCFLDRDSFQKHVY